VKESSSGSAASQTGLDPQHLAGDAQLLELKARIKDARELVGGLPDVERTIGEQEMDIEDLEERVKDQRAVLEGLVRLVKEEA
jgi:RNA polymerase II transcription mediator complex subunit 9